MSNNKMIYLLLADYPKVRYLLYSEKVTNLYKKYKMVKELREDILKLRDDLIVREENDTKEEIYVVESD
ncbi:MAG: hypothetical protein KKD44_28770 [Proteobacteria bacterium]|nr:hypothetical protein [Pseudomonadota bacterium]